MKNSKIQILRIVIGLNQGGVQQAVLNLAKNIDRSKFNLIVCAIENGGLIANEIKESGTNVIVLGYKRQPIKTILALIKVIKANKIDIVHASSYHPSLYGRIAAILSKVPIIMSYEHVIFDHFRPARAFLNLTLNFFTDAYTAVSKGVSDQVIRWYKYPKNKVYVLYNGVDTTKFSPVSSTTLAAKDKLGINHKNLVISMICRLDLSKGHKYFFEAITRLKKKQNIQYMIVGTGPHEASIIDLAKAYGLEKSIKFLGVRRDIDVCMNATDIFCFPTLQEGFSNVLLEAMSSGCPVIASNFPSNLEVIKHKKNGLVVEMRNPDELAKAIQKYIDSPSLRKKMSTEARKTIERSFSVATYSNRAEYIYQKLWDAKNV
jgi:glycosyltransferase involved in cell wall biosynthesis